MSMRFIDLKLRDVLFCGVCPGNGADVRQDRIFNAKQTLVPKIRRLAESERPERPEQ